MNDKEVKIALKKAHPQLSLDDIDDAIEKGGKMDKKWKKEILKFSEEKKNECLLNLTRLIYTLRGQVFNEDFKGVEETLQILIMFLSFVEPKENNE